MSDTSTVNGHAPAHAKKMPVATRRLQTWRIEEGSRHYVRFLAYSALGMYTHWYNKRSNYCKGEHCNPIMHRVDPVWKGYAPVERWDKESNLWLPEVLEVTENLELDLRGQCARGQVWDLYRELKKDRKQMPVVGVLVEERDPDLFPLAFDILPVLKALYHTSDIRLVHENPMPSRIFLPSSGGDAPGPIAAETRAKEAKGRAEQEASQKRLEERYKTGKMSDYEKRVYEQNMKK